ncbi:nucleotidyltransferase family protein [Candidatus Woesearchaeota archaeon]|nr:nucleotidyltransferase family protein [Candidatus Woesearchaeota archaeon]
MKCIILAAGYATRLHPVAKYVPKPFLDVGGRPIIDHIVEKVKKLKADEICAVTNHRFFPIFAEWGREQNVKVVDDGTMSNEDRLGAIKDLVLGINAVDDDDILCIGGDNLFEDMLDTVVGEGRTLGKVVIGLYDVKTAEEAKRFGVITSEGSKIVSFEEKPSQPKTTIISTLVYYLPKKSISLVKEFAGQGKDNAGELIKYLMQNTDVHGVILKGKWMDIGKLEHLEQARREFYSGQWKLCE